MGNNGDRCPILIPLRRERRTLPGTGQLKLEEAVWSCPTRLLSTTYYLTLDTPYYYYYYYDYKI